MQFVFQWLLPYFSGEILVTEIPYSSILLPEYYNSHCQSCYHRVLSPIPCWCCARVSLSVWISHILSKPLPMHTGPDWIHFVQKLFLWPKNSFILRNYQKWRKSGFSIFRFPVFPVFRNVFPVFRFLFPGFPVSVWAQIFIFQW